MSFLNKLGIGIGSTARRDVSRPVGANARPRTSGTPPVGGSAPRAPESRETTRVSNGLKELLWNLDGLGKGKLLDLGPAWQTTLSFFIERGFRVSSEDVLRGWKAFLTEEEARLREDASAIESLDMTPGGRSEEHTSELQSRLHLVCRLLLEKKKNHGASAISAEVKAPTNDFPPFASLSRWSRVPADTRR